MDSLLATYASSDEEEQDDQQQQQQHQNPKQIQSNSFSSLPPPKQTLAPTKKSSHPESRSDSKSLFSRLPQPKSERSDPFSLNPKPKKVVQFRPPIIPKIEDDDEEEEDDYKEKQRIKEEFIPQAPSVKSFLSSIPAPRNSGSLGALPSSAGTGRRSILDAQVSGLSNSNAVADKPLDNPVKSESSHVNYDNNTYASVGSNESESANVAATSAGYGSYDYGNYGGYENVDMNNSSYGPAPPSESGDHGGYGGYEGYSDYGQYESKWIDRSSGDLGPEVSEPVVQNVGRASGKRGRNEIPQDVIEVSQDELMKNRPREDQVKMTGIAFGPAYQPASSAKGKPTKLHKRKHQIGSLYFDMRSKEMELAERRSKGFLTKAETQAKYGW